MQANPFYLDKSTMKKKIYLFIAPSIIAITACTTAQTTSPPTANSSVQYPAFNLSPASKGKIGRKIWQNESAGKVSGLTQWNDGEEFPSIGIGHFIWYPSGFNGRFKESFPLFVQYAQQRGSRDLPNWLINTRHAPWPNKAAFQRDFNNPQMVALRKYLANNVTLQTDFIIQRSRAAFKPVLAAAPANQRARISANYNKVASTPNGTYALIDYVNFKGDGVSKSERYNSQGWGLMQVLMEMRSTSSGQPAAAEFAAAAKRTLDRRIKNSPPARGESRWRAGWHNRCDTYARPL